MARMGRSRASALMKFTRTITVTRIERQIVGVLPIAVSPANSCEVPLDAALPAAERSPNVPADAPAASERADGMGRERE